jgi:Na+/proline symporter
VVGYLDDLIIVSLGIWLVLSLIPGDVIAELRVQASEAARLPRSRAAAIIIIAIWILAAAALGWVGFAYWARPQ